MKYGNVNLGQVEALINKIGGESAIARVLSGELVITEPGNLVKAKRVATPKVLADLLEEVGEPTKLSAAERFVARDKFVVNQNGELPISYLGDNFKGNFLDVVEEDVKPMTAKQRKLRKSSVDGPILAALGDKDLNKIEKARVALAHAFEFLKTADKSKWYIFYVADAKGVVWAVGARWDGGGWYVEAFPVTRPNVWRGGRHVVSR
jgi:hypothetical protein